MKAIFEVKCDDFNRSCEISMENSYLAKELSDNLMAAMDLHQLKIDRYNKSHQLDLALETLRMIAQNSYGTEISNPTEENNEILASHYFINQQLARETLEKIKLR